MSYPAVKRPKKKRKEKEALSAPCKVVSLKTVDVACNHRTFRKKQNETVKRAVICRGVGQVGGGNGQPGTEGVPGSVKLPHDTLTMDA